MYPSFACFTSKHKGYADGSDNNFDVKSLEATSLPTKVRLDFNWYNVDRDRNDIEFVLPQNVNLDASIISATFCNPVNGTTTKAAKFVMPISPIGAWFIEHAFLARTTPTMIWCISSRALLCPFLEQIVNKIKNNNKRRR